MEDERDDDVIRVPDRYIVVKFVPDWRRQKVVLSHQVINFLTLF